jgi:hypothetical protein
MERSMPYANCPLRSKMRSRGVLVDYGLREREPEEIDPVHLSAVLEGLKQAKRRDFATGAEMEAAPRLFDL